MKQHFHSKTHKWICSGQGENVRYYPYFSCRGKAQILELGGNWEKAERLYSENLEQAGLGDHQLLWAESKNDQARMKIKRGQNQEAFIIAEQGLEAYRRLHHPAGEWQALSSLGQIYRNQGKNRESMEKYGSCLEIAEKTGDLKLKAKTLIDFGVSYYNQSEYDRAEQAYMSALDIAAQTGDQNMMARVLNNLGVIQQQLCNYEKALDNYQKALDIVRRMGDKQAVSQGLSNIGSLHYLNNDQASALSCYREFLKNAEEIGDRRGVCQAIGNIGVIEIDRNDFAGAKVCFKQYQDIALKMGDKRGMAIALTNLAGIMSMEGEYEQAVDAYREISSLFSELGDRKSLSYTLGHWANVHKARREWVEAKRLYKQAVSLSRDLKLKYFLCDQLFELADLNLVSGNKEGEVDLADEAKEIATAIKREDVVFNCRLLDARTLGLTDPPGAVAFLEAMLTENPGEEQAAEINYYIFLINGSVESRARAAEYYRRMFSQQNVPKIKYRDRLESIEAGLRKKDKGSD